MPVQKVIGISESGLKMVCLVVHVQASDNDLEAKSK